MSVMIRTAAIAALLMLLTPAAQAGNQSIIAEVIEIGLTKTGVSFIKLKNTEKLLPDGVKKFLLPKQTRKEMLAIGLSAVSAGLKVRVIFNLDDPPPTIKQMYLRNE